MTRVVVVGRGWDDQPMALEAVERDGMRVEALVLSRRPEDEDYRVASNVERIGKRWPGLIMTFDGTRRLSPFGRNVSRVPVGEGIDTGALAARLATRVVVVARAGLDDQPIAADARSGGERWNAVETLVPSRGPEDEDYRVASNVEQIAKR